MKLARALFPGVDEVFQERYRIVAELGAGGFGTVYKAVQLATGQQVAIKVMRPVGARDAKAVEKRIARLEREMRLCAQLHHPNIVGLIDFGRTEDGSVYSVFEYIPGKNLEELLAEEGALSPVEARHLMLQVLDALACAHGQGVIHRDLKPSNIMVISTGARRNALVLDFGIGVVTDTAPGMSYSRLTATNEVLGTIAYASPEQLFGKPTSPASDLYSWGLVFLECLTGIPVVHGASMMDALFKQMAGAELTLPAALHEHPLGKLLRAAAAKKVEERPASAREVMKRLEECDVSDLRRDQLAQAPSVAKPSEAAGGAVAPAAPTLDSAPPPAPASKTQSVEYAPRRASDVPEEPVPGERRQVTAVCATLSVVAGEDGQLDIEEADQLLGAGQETCARVAARFRGHPTGAMGNQTLFWFGFPAADEDDARRAARAALEMIADIERETASLQALKKARLQIRIAVHTGIVVQRPTNSPATQRLVASFGTTSNVAALLSSATDPGEIVVSGSAYQLLRHHFSFASQGTRKLVAHALGGAVTNVDVYRLEWPISTLHAMAAERPEGPIVGREHEIDLLLQRWDEVRRGRGQVVLLSGETGIGKSRLVRELASRIRNVPHRWLECRSAPENQNNALHPIVDMLERTLELAEEEAPARKLAKLRQMLQSLDFTLDDSVPLFSKLLGIPLNGNGNGNGHANGNGKNGHTKHEVAPQLMKEQLLNALVSLFFELSEREAVVLAAEDLQWTDPTTLELFSMLVKEASSARILVLMSARPNFVPPWKLTDVLQVQLGRLGRDQIREMVKGFGASGDAPPSSVLDQIVDRTDGVPLFVEELTRMMFESGVFSGEGRPSIRPGLAVPGTLRDLLTARLDRLGRAKGTAQVGAALGREFSFELLAAVSPLTNSKLLLEDLDALVAADLVHRKRRAKGQSYAFKHALIRDAAYESMLKRARQKVHADIARALIERFSDTAAARPDLLAAHLAEAQREAEAVRYMLKAVDDALQHSANAEAMGYAQQAFEWLEAVELGRARLEMELHLQSATIAALIALKGPGTTEVESRIERAQDLLGQVSDSPFMVPILIRLALYYQMRGRYQEASAVGERCLALAERTGDSAAQVASLTILAQNHWFTGDLHGAEATAERALSIYDAAKHASYAIVSYAIDFRVTCHGVLCTTLWLLGHPDRALDVAQKGVAHAEELGHANSKAMALLYLTGIQRYRRDLQEFGKALGQFHEVTKRHGLYVGAFASVYFGWVTGEVEGPKQIVAGFRAYGHVFSMTYWDSVIAETDAAAGRFDAALERIEACIHEAQTIGELYYLPELLRLKGALLLKQDARAVEAAENTFRRAIDAARSQRSRMFELRSITSLGALVRASGRAEEIRSPLEWLCREITEGPELPDLKEARALLAELPN